jgi:protein phosphatase
MQLTAHGLTDSGLRRTQNEDAILWYTVLLGEQPAGLYAVADGMGGQNAGEVASRIAIEAIQAELGGYLDRSSARSQPRSDDAVTAPLKLEETVEAVEQDAPLVNLVLEAIQRCNDLIREYGELHTDAVGLGSTLTLALVIGNVALIGNIGDSRTYLVRDGMIASLTADHSLVGSLYRQGLITEQEVYNHPHRNLIYNALGTKADATPDIVLQRLQVDDILLLCSDGLWEMVRDDQIRDILMSFEKPEDAAAALVQRANQEGGLDNIGVVVVRVS